MTATVLIIISTLILSAFFSGMEIAFVSSNKIHIEIEKQQEGFLAGILAKITRKPSQFITTMLIGNNIVLVIYGIYMGQLLVQLLQPQEPLQSSFLNYWLTGSGLLVTQTVISTLVILFTAEFFPKVFFQIYANSLLKIFAFPAYFFYLIFNGFSTFVMWIANSVLKLFFNIEGDEVQQAFTKMELGNYINEQMETIEDEEEMDSEILYFKNALEFSDIKAREVMVPRPEVVSMQADESIDTIKSKFIETGLSKILIYENDIDHVLGYIHSFDLFKKPQTLQEILLPIIYVPETMAAKDVLNALVKKRTSLALVIDEYGGTSGIASVEDIVEELFGEIEDEHDSAVIVENDLGNGRYEFSARAEIDYLNEIYKLNIPKSENYETLSGFIVHHTEDIPEENGVINIGDFEIKILKASNAKIELIQIQNLNNQEN